MWRLGAPRFLGPPPAVLEPRAGRPEPEPEPLPPPPPLPPSLSLSLGWHTKNTTRITGKPSSPPSPATVRPVPTTKSGSQMGPQCHALLGTPPQSDLALSVTADGLPKSVWDRARGGGAWRCADRTSKRSAGGCPGSDDPPAMRSAHHFSFGDGVSAVFAASRLSRAEDCPSVGRGPADPHRPPLPLPYIGCGGTARWGIAGLSPGRSFAPTGTPVGTAGARARALGWPRGCERSGAA